MIKQVVQLEANMGTISVWGHHEKEGKREQTSVPCARPYNTTQGSGSALRTLACGENGGKTAHLVGKPDEASQRKS